MSGQPNSAGPGCDDTRNAGTDHIVWLVVVLLIGRSSVVVGLNEYDFSCRMSIGSGRCSESISVLVIL